MVKIGLKSVRLVQNGGTWLNLVEMGWINENWFDCSSILFFFWVIFWLISLSIGILAVLWPMSAPLWLLVNWTNLGCQISNDFSLAWFSSGKLRSVERPIAILSPVIHFPTWLTPNALDWLHFLGFQVRIYQQPAIGPVTSTRSIQSLKNWFKMAQSETMNQTL